MDAKDCLTIQLINMITQLVMNVIFLAAVVSLQKIDIFLDDAYLDVRNVAFSYPYFVFLIENLPNNAHMEIRHKSTLAVPGKINKYYGSPCKLLLNQNLNLASLGPYPNPAWGSSNLVLSGATLTHSLTKIIVARLLF